MSSSDGPEGRGPNFNFDTLYVFLCIFALFLFLFVSFYLCTYFHFLSGFTCKYALTLKKAKAESAQFDLFLHC